jgi:cyanate permease
VTGAAPGRPEVEQDGEIGLDHTRSKSASPAATSHDDMSAQPRPAAPSPAPQSAGGWLLPLAVVMIGSFMAVLDTSIVNVAIPTMQKELGASADQVLWVATGYTLALGVVVPLSGRLADGYGMDRVLNLALILFVVGSALCGLATGATP